MSVSDLDRKALEVILILVMKKLCIDSFKITKEDQKSLDGSFLAIEVQGDDLLVRFVSRQEKDRLDKHYNEVQA